jgi:hypothetical protein
VYASLLVLVTGCGGLNMRQSVSPASFFLPGLLKTEPPPAPRQPAPPVESPAAQVAFAR